MLLRFHFIFIPPCVGPPMWRCISSSTSVQRNVLLRIELIFCNNPIVNISCLIATAIPAYNWPIQRRSIMLNENIKALRKAKGLSQEELAIKLTVVRQTVSKWEKGLSVPDAGMLMKIADALDTTVNTLLGETVEEPEEHETVKSIAAKLELMNEQYAKQMERHRKIWRTVFVILGVIAVIGLVKGVLGFIHLQQFNSMVDSSTSIIGGADAATTIYVSSISADKISLVMTVLIAIVSGIGIYHTKKQ